MEPDSPIAPFVFVDGRKYILAETEERPEPEIFAKLTPPPRNASPFVRWRIFFRREGDLLLIVFAMSILCSCGALYVMGAEIVAGFILATLTSLLPFVYSATNRVISAMRESTGLIQLLQSGLIGKGRFHGMCATGKKVDNFAEVQLKYQFSVEDGNSYNASFMVANIKQIMELADESLKLIFYEQAQPNRNLLFDSLPKGIWFDEFDAMFRTSPLAIYTQVLGLCIAAWALPAICFAVFLL